MCLARLCFQAGVQLCFLAQVLLPVKRLPAIPAGARWVPVSPGRYVPVWGQSTHEPEPPVFISFDSLFACPTQQGRAADDPHYAGLVARDEADEGVSRRGSMLVVNVAGATRSDRCQQRERIPGQIAGNPKSGNQCHPQHRPCNQSHYWLQRYRSQARAVQGHHQHRQNRQYQ